MIKFFRRIRKNLLSPDQSSGAKRRSRLGQYFIYAVGEIILVVIGILIALQINNWNQNRINTQKEIIHLENILSNLSDDLHSQLIPCIERTTNQIQAFELLNTNFFESNSISNDSIKQLFFTNLGQWDLILNTVAFENLKSSGMDIISNDSIKLKLLTIYGNNYPYVKKLQEDYDRTHEERVSSWFFENTIEMWEELRQVDKEKILNNRQLFNAMKSEANYSLRNYLNELKSIRPISEELIENIREEIGRLRGER